MARLCVGRSRGAKWASIHPSIHSAHGRTSRSLPVPRRSREARISRLSLTSASSIPRLTKPSLAGTRARLADCPQLFVGARRDLCECVAASKSSRAESPGSRLSLRQQISNCVSAGEDFLRPTSLFARSIGHSWRCRGGGGGTRFSAKLQAAASSTSFQLECLSTFAIRVEWNSRAVRRRRSSRCRSEGLSSRTVVEARTQLPQSTR